MPVLQILPSYKRPFRDIDVGHIFEFDGQMILKCHNVVVYLDGGTDLFMAYDVETCRTWISDNTDVIDHGLMRIEKD